MKACGSGWGRIAPMALMAMMALGLGGGCENDRFDFDHDPPPGQGSLVVDNCAGVNLDVFIDGVEQERVREWKHKIWDLAPGLHRLALRDRDEGRFFSDDVDIVEGRLTVAEVYVSSDGRSLEVAWGMD